MHSHSLDFRDPTLVACAMPLASEIERFPTDIDYIDDSYTKNGNTGSLNPAKLGFKKYYNKRKVLYNCLYE